MTPTGDRSAIVKHRVNRSAHLVLTSCLLLNTWGCGDNAIGVELDQLDVQSFLKLQFVFDTFAWSSEAIWREPGDGQTFRLDTIPILWMRLLDGPEEEGAPARAVDPDGYLIHHPHPNGPQLYHPVFDAMAPVHHQVVSAELLPDDERTYRLNLTLAGANTFVFAYGEGPGDEFDPRMFGFLTLLVHEGFHRYQFYESGWTRYPDWVSEPESYPIVEGNVSLAILEDQVLAAGLRATTSEDRDLALRQFYAVRVARRGLPEVVVNGINFVDQSDSALEHYEGGADYTSKVRFLEAAGLGSEEFAAASLARQLEASLTDAAFLNEAGVVRYNFSRGRFYTTGAALGLLMDALDIDWKSAAKLGMGPFQVLQTHYAGLSDSELAMLLAQAKQGHDFDGAIATATYQYFHPDPAAPDMQSRRMKIPPMCVEPGAGPRHPDISDYEARP
jgi:hypothetical protein